MLPTERITYSPIAGRPPLKLPNGARMAVWVIVNVEEWDIKQTMPRTVLTPPAGGSPMPDIPNWAWHEYGNRVGFWRMLKVFDDYEIPGVLAINGVALAAYLPIVEAAKARNWEFMGHGFTQRNMQKVENTQECNDVAMMLIQHHKASEYYDRAIDQFEQIYEDSADSARVMALVVHPYIMGAPHRLKHFRRIFETIRQKPDVTFMTGEQILDWYLSVGPKAPRQEQE